MLRKRKIPGGWRGCASSVLTHERCMLRNQGPCPNVQCIFFLSSIHSHTRNIIPTKLKTILKKCGSCQLVMELLEFFSQY